MNTQMEYKTGNAIENAFNQGLPGVVLTANANNPFRLHRFKKKYNVDATGKNLDGKYVIVFWDNLNKYKTEE